MVEFSCPACGRNFAVASEDLKKVDYLSCPDCKRIVPHDLLQALKDTCYHLEVCCNEQKTDSWHIRFSEEEESFHS
jgi:DNA-directed RNA polymerase subunit RPC12/RpoP